MPKPYSVGSVSDLIFFLPDNMERVLASQFHHQHDLMALDGVREQVLPTAMIRYMVVVLARSSSAT